MPKLGSEDISLSPALSGRGKVLLNEIRRFPGICKDLESGKETSVRGYEGREAALAELTASRERLKVRAEALTGAGAAT
jgi:inorganic pyrophosphatase